MRLVPTLWLGPRRLARRPVESIVLFLAVALGSLGTILAVDATIQLTQTTAQGASDPGLRRISLFANLDVPRNAVYPKELWNRAIDQYERFPADTLWFEKALPRLPPVETAFARYASWAKVRTGSDGPWAEAPWSSCADPRIFAQKGVEMVAGRTFTQDEWASGRRIVVVGTQVLGRILPGVTPAQALGRTLEVNPVSGYETSEAVTIVGVCRGPTGVPIGSLGPADQWLALTKLPQIHAKYGRGLEFVFQTRTTDEVPALLAGLRVLVDQEPTLKGQVLESPYENFLKLGVVYLGIEVLILSVGGGTFLIALWTLGSVFRSRMPSMTRSLRLLRALGADRRTLIFLGLSEILPVALGGLVVGGAGALALRQLVTPGPWFSAQDPWVLGGLVAFALGFQAFQVAPVMVRPGSDLPLVFRRHQGQTLRLILTVLFLVLGLAVSALALSLQQDLVRFFKAMNQPAPLWVGETQTNGGDWFFPVYHGDVDTADLAAVGRIVDPELWTPYLAFTDSGTDKDVDVVGPPAQPRQFVRTKVFAKPLILELFHAPLLAGRIPTDQESRDKKYALVSEEVAQDLFGGQAQALGQAVRPVQGNFPALTGTFVVCGVFGSPNGLQSRSGYPDILFVPDAELTQTLLSAQTGRLYGARLAFDADKVDPRVLADRVVPLLASAHPHLELERFLTWQGGGQSRDQGGVLDEIHRVTDQLFFAASLLTILFLVVSCLSVLSFMFVSITSRSRQIAVERALGRSLGYFLGQAFLQGSLMVLVASVLALGLDAVLLPILSSALGDSMGALVPDSRGRLGLDAPTVVLLCLGSATLAGLVGLLPLLPYRKIPIAIPMKDES